MTKYLSFLKDASARVTWRERITITHGVQYCKIWYQHDTT